MMFCAYLIHFTTIGCIFRGIFCGCCSDSRTLLKEIVQQGSGNREKKFEIRKQINLELETEKQGMGNRGPANKEGFVHRKKTSENRQEMEDRWLAN
jgi:hypothetical protein